MFTAGDSSSTLPCNLVKQSFGQILLGTNVDTLLPRRECDSGDLVTTLLDELSLTLVPSRKELRRWSSSNETWVGHTGEADTGNVTRGGVDTCG